MALLCGALLLLEKVVLIIYNPSVFKEFKQFIFRGNAIDLAVGVVIGAAFGTVVSALVSDLLTPFIASIAKVPDFSCWVITLNNNHFMIGHLLNAVISFVIVALAIFLFVVKPMSMVIARAKRKEAATTKKCTECLSEIPIEAKRCAHCTQPVPSS